jgi:hypothetical protein
MNPVGISSAVWWYMVVVRVHISRRWYGWLPQLPKLPGHGVHERRAAQRSQWRDGDDAWNAQHARPGDTMAGKMDDVFSGL